MVVNNEVKVRNFGGSDALTSPTCFYHEFGSPDHIAQFEQVTARLMQLSRTTVRSSLVRDDGELVDVNDNALDLITAIDRADGQLIAFRFTSDMAYRIYHPELMAMGGGLGRGVWRPFTDNYMGARWYGWERKPQQ